MLFGLGRRTTPSDAQPEFPQALRDEHQALLGIVKDFDARLLTVKGWGVTLSLAALAWGFEKGHFGLFLVAALSGFGFWMIEGVMKRHQMRFYVRMREIEVLAFKGAGSRAELSSPRIDWSWRNAQKLYTEKGYDDKGPQPIVLKDYETSFLFLTLNHYRLVWLYPHVFLPHCISVGAGLLLWFIAWQGWLPGITTW